MDELASNAIGSAVVASAGFVPDPRSGFLREELRWRFINRRKA